MFKKFILLFIVLVVPYTQAAYYEPNDGIQSYLDDMTASFTKITSYAQL
jgi:hypothetical protein